MKKLRLDPEQLAVDSFAAADGAARPGSGTVHARARCTYWNTCQCPTGLAECGGPDTFSCDFTGGTCEP